jgi:hypothetical protein
MATYKHNIIAGNIKPPAVCAHAHCTT